MPGLMAPLRIISSLILISRSLCSASSLSLFSLSILSRSWRFPKVLGVMWPGEGPGRLERPGDIPGRLPALLALRSFSSSFRSRSSLLRASLESGTGLK